MSKQSKFIRLDEVAYQLAAEVWEGKWDHLAEIKQMPIEYWTELPKVLEQLVPGCTREQYVNAIGRAMLRP